MSMESEKHNSAARDTIAQKIDRLKEFCENNPVLWISGYDFLNSIEDSGKRKNLEERFNQALSDYDYIRIRKSRGKLSNENIETLRESGAGRVFGYKKEIEDVAKKYSYDDVNSFKKFLYYACAEYGSLDNFKQHYIQSLINGGADKYSVGRFLNKHVQKPDDLDKYFITDFDISNPNFKNEGNEGYIKLCRRIRTDSVIMDRTKIKEVLRKLNEREECVLKLHFGLNDGIMRTQEEVAKEFEITGERVRKIENKAFNKLTRIFQTSTKIHIMEKDTEKAFIEKYFEYHDIFADEKPVELDKMAKKELQIILYGRELENDNEKIEDIANKYSYDDVENFKKFLHCACAEYGNLDSFKQHYIQSLINGGTDKYNVGEFLNKYVQNPNDLDKYLITYFDISSPNFQNEGNEGYIKLYRRIRPDSVIMDRTKINEALMKLNKREKCILRLHLGLDDDRMPTLEEVAEEFNITEGMARKIENKAFNKLANIFRNNTRFHIAGKDVEKAFIKKYFEYHDIFADEKPVELNEIVKKELQSILDGKEVEFDDENSERTSDCDNNLERNPDSDSAVMSAEEEKRKLKLEDLNLSARSYNALKRAFSFNIKNVGDIIDLKKKEFERIRGLGGKTGGKTADEVIDKIHSLGLEMEWERNKDMAELDEKSKRELEIADLDLSVRSHNALGRAGFNSVDKIIKLGRKEFENIRGLKGKNADEVIDKIHSLGLKMGWEEDKETTDAKLKGAIQQLKTVYSDSKTKDEEYEKLKSQVEEAKGQVQDNLESTKSGEINPNEKNDTSEAPKHKEEDPSYGEL